MKTEEQTPLSAEKGTKEIDVQEMIRRNGSQEAWQSKLDALHDSYKPAILEATRRLMFDMDLIEYIDVLTYSNEEFVSSKRWETWDEDMKRTHAMAYTHLMNFLHKLDTIEKMRNLERDVRGV